MALNVCEHNDASSSNENDIRSRYFKCCSSNRREVLTRYDTILEGRKIDVALWAVLQIGDIDCLQGIVDSLERKRDYFEADDPWMSRFLSEDAFGDSSGHSVACEYSFPTPTCIAASDGSLRVSQPCCVIAHVELREAGGVGSDNEGEAKMLLY